MTDKTPEEAQALYRSLTKSVSATGSVSRNEADKPEQLIASERLMEKLWELMTSMYGHKWTSVHGLDDGNGVWARAMGGVTGAQIAHGMQRCLDQKMEWPPSAPQFKSMCEAAPADYGLPPEDKAFSEACRNAHPAMAGIARWSHDAVYHAAHETGFYNLNTLKYQDSSKLFGRNYAIAVRMVMAGEKLRAMPLALPEKVDARSTPEVGQYALEKIRNQLRGSTDE